MTKKRFNGSIIYNLPISRKIFLAFVLVGVLFSIQSLFSVGSINQLEDAFLDTQDQNKVNEQIREIIGLHKSEVELFSKRLIGIESHSVLNSTLYASRQFLEEQYKDLRPKILASYSYEEGGQIFDTIEGNRDAYYATVNPIFINPSMNMLDNIEIELNRILSQMNEGLRHLNAWIHTQNSSYEEDYIGFFGDNITLTENFELSYVTENYDLSQINPTTFAKIDGMKNDIDEQIKLLRVRYQYLRELRELVVNFTDMSENSYTAYNGTIIAIQDIFHNVTIIFDNVFNVLRSSRIYTTNSYMNANTNLGAIEDNFLRLIEISVDKQKRLNENFTDNIQFVYIVILIVFLIMVILILVVTSIVNFQIANPIKTITQWSERISDGDLSMTRRAINRRDEIGVLHANFREMCRNLRQLISEVKDTAILISTTSEDLSSNTEEINATTEEVSAIAQSMAKGSLHQAELIASIVNELQDTSEIVDDVISQINYNLVIIRDLSEQTKVLSLNTAIEAANAGDFGKGFTVIAENIRKMSIQSKAATEKITKNSREILSKLRTTFNTITKKIEVVASVSEETAASAEEVAASAEEMTATMENVSAISGELNAQSDQSLEVVNRFIL